MAAGENRKSSESEGLASDVKREAGAAAGRVADDVRRAKDNIAQAATDTRDELGDELRRLREDFASLKDTVLQLASAVGAEIGEAAGEIGDEVASSARRQTTTIAADLEDMTRRNPLGFMAGAFILGLLIGMLRSR
jgi:hypothetical protein